MTTIADFFKLVKASRLCCRSSPVDHGTIKPRVAQQAPASNTADRRCFTWRRWPKRGGCNPDRHRLLMGWNEARTQDFGPAIIDFHQLSAKHSWKSASSAIAATCGNRTGQCLIFWFSLSRCHAYKTHVRVVGGRGGLLG
jgi:hypothetical protein